MSAACASGEGGEGVMGEIVRATGALEIIGDDKSAVSHDMSHDSLVTPPSDEEIRRLWGEVYNTRYWYWYQRWREDLAQNGGEEGEGGCVEGECGEGGCEEGEGVEGKCVEEECGEGGCEEGECGEGGCQDGEICEESGDRAKGGWLGTCLFFNHEKISCQNFNEHFPKMFTEVFVQHCLCV